MDEGVRLETKKAWPDDQVKIGPILLIHPRTFPLKISKEACQEKALVTTAYIWRDCKRWRHMPGILIDRYTLKRDGACQLWVMPQGIDMKSVHASLGERPWSLKP